MCLRTFFLFKKKMNTFPVITSNTRERQGYFSLVYLVCRVVS